MKNKWAVLAALTLVTGMSSASDDVGHWYLNPQIGAVWTDNDRGFDDDIYYGLGLGWHVSEGLSLEVNGSAGTYDGPDGTELDITTASLDLLLVFYRDRRITPFLSLGPGYIDKSFNGDGGEDASDWMAQAGAGLLIQLGQSANKARAFNLRPEVKVRWDFADTPEQDFFVDYLFGLGFQFSF